jgi:hypothetical protein
LNRLLPAIFVVPNVERLTFAAITRNAPEELFHKTIDELRKCCFISRFIFRANHCLTSAISGNGAVRKRKIYTLSTMLTIWQSAHKPLRSGLDRLIISLDGTTQSTNNTDKVEEKVVKVLENVIRLKGMKSKTPHVIFNFVVK